MRSDITVYAPSLKMTASSDRGSEAGREKYSRDALDPFLKVLNHNGIKDDGGVPLSWKVCFEEGALQHEEWQTAFDEAGARLLRQPLGP